MVKQEWKNIFHNTWIKVVMVAIIAIPSLYACIFLGSMWDPYGNSGAIPVAVVNEDKEVTYNDASLAVGEELVKNLRDNDSMEFHFVNASDALRGLEDSQYYMIITIPNDFSKNATTLLDKQPQKMVLNYTTNPGTNYIASKMDDSAIAKIKAEVSASVTKTYAESIFKQISVLSNGLGEASDGTNQLTDGVDQLRDGNKTISDNLKVLASSSLTFQDGASTLTKGLKDYTDGIITVNNGVYTLKNGLDTLNHSTGALATGVNRLNEGAKELQTGVNQYTAGAQQAYEGTQQLIGNNQVLQIGAESLGQATQTLSAGVSDLESKVSAAQTSLSSYLDLYNTLKSSNSALAGRLKDSGLDAATVSSITGGKVTTELPSFESMLLQMNDSVSELNTAVKTQLKPGTQELNAKVNGGSYTTLNSQHQPTQVTVDQKQSLVYGVKTYLAGASQVNSGLKVLTANNQSLAKGSQELAEGTELLVKQIPTLMSGVKALDSGASDLYKGTSTLVSNNSTILNGSKALSTGASQISSGANQLADGSHTLGTGLNTVKTGVSTLNTSLKDGADKSKMTTTNSTFDMMASPVDTTHNEISTVENNGHAMAPYMMSVALYVAGLAFTLMYPVLEGAKDAESGWKYWLSKATVMFTISTIAAIVMISCLRIFNGFEPQQLMQTYLFAILVSAAFMALIVLLNVTTGYIGEFLLLVFMIINLGGSAGTYPLETSAGFFKAIHNFVPYTYSVNGFRKVISMANASLTTEVIVFVGILIGCSVLTILYYHFKKNREKHLIPQAFEKHE